MHGLLARERAPRDRVSLRTRLAAVALVFLALAVACAGGGDDADDNDIPGVYIAVIRSLGPDGSATMPKSIFVEALPGTKLSLQDQAAIVQAFDDTAVRFIDDRDEAVDSKSPQSPVRRDGVLLQMSPAETTDTGVSIKTTRYVALDDTRTSCLELELRSEEWQIATSRAC